MRSILFLAVVVLASAVIGSGCDSARPVAEASNNTAERCSGCHGFPPPPNVTTQREHPDSVACSLCHRTTVDANYNLVPGGTHLNGTVDETVHDFGPTFLAEHTTVALQDLNECKKCHGTDFAGGASGASCTSCHAGFGFSDWQTNCTFCHGSRTQGFALSAATLPLAAPPRGAHGETSTTVSQVGAHQKHVGNGSAISDGVACAECHSVPADLTHLNGAAQLTFGPLATQGGLTPSYSGGSCSATYCHGSTLVGGSDTTPTWTASVACGNCHGSPPATGRHLITEQHATRNCAACHAQVAADIGTPAILNSPAAKALHVNGEKNVSFIGGVGTWDPAAQTCSNVACHTFPPAVRHW